MVSFDLLSSAGDREVNEDQIGMYQREENYCFVLADGLGGQGNGAVASRAAVNAAIEDFACGNGADGGPGQRICRAQEGIQAIQEEDFGKRDMRSTFVVLEIGPDEARWGHIGDSRLYLFQNGKVKRRTLDHSVPQMLVNAGELKERKIRNHPDRNRVLRALGESVDEVRYELSEPLPLCDGQAFLLCSDGFWELIEENKMERCLKKAGSPAQWLRMMEEIVLRNGRRRNMDNYSAIGVWIR